ncbi:hypothetical protein BDV36DRAFT_258371 [Aspergillus pseudocaelatus]|uniref:Uncharacterized protein n=1 Tax=Aspergillus pseudocaelatus TaxID=1825620 RepID=A0ABQ6WIK2_9EURO|nr:hypothetical protein BDV36DRAFT_258371 [Aspergillus pseudocaelatus]
MKRKIPLLQEKPKLHSPDPSKLNTNHPTSNKHSHSDADSISGSDTLKGSLARFPPKLNAIAFLACGVFGRVGNWAGACICFVLFLGGCGCFWVV